MLTQSNADSSYAYNYAFDPIGNRLTASQAGTNWSYGTNNLNQYAQLTTNLSSTPTYDADGNVLSRSSHHPTQPLNWNYEWNGENRLIRVTNIRDVAAEMSYDYMGRRIEKKVYAYAGGLIGFLQLQSHRRYVYDDYKLVEELDALNNNAVIRRYTWQPNELGLDVPLSVYDVTLDKIYYYHTDANKNVTELTDAEGNVIAHYEYSPFGQIVKQSGSYADANPFRFSSEYYDAETKLIYYNYRHYDPEVGRWLSRDPIEEIGGINLYNFTANNSINKYDRLGLNSSSTDEDRKNAKNKLDAANEAYNRCLAENRCPEGCADDQPSRREGLKTSTSCEHVCRMEKAALEHATNEMNRHLIEEGGGSTRRFSKRSNHQEARKAY